MSASLLIEHASWEETEEHDIEAAKRWGKATLVFALSKIPVIAILCEYLSQIGVAVRVI